MLMDEAITIVIPTHNEIKYLPNLICCLENQTFTDFTTIVVDNRSTDGTRQFCEAKGIPIVANDSIIASIADEIGLIKNEISIEGAIFDERVKPAFDNLIRFVHLVPASEFRHQQCWRFDVPLN